MNRRVFLEYCTFSSSLLIASSRNTYAQQLIPGMKTVGLIGGTSWHSTIDYYRIINELTNQQLGEKVNPPLLLVNLNQAHIHALQAKDDWASIREIYQAKAKALVAAGAEAIAFAPIHHIRLLIRFEAQSQNQFCILLMPLLMKLKNAKWTLLDWQGLDLL
jgi:hypothetical protein